MWSPNGDPSRTIVGTVRANRWPTTARIIFATTSHGTVMGAHAITQAVESASCAQVTFQLNTGGDRVGRNSCASSGCNMNHDSEQ